MNEHELARLIATLEHLKKPFDRKQISKLPRTDKRPELDYVNHAHVTNRLNLYAPDCSWVVDEMFTQNGECWIRGTMTIYGASRVEFGKGKNPLEAMSHFIRRAAMRFGVAADLWAKEDFEESSGPFEPQTPDEAAGLGDALPSPAAERGGVEPYGEGGSAPPDSSDTDSDVVAPVGDGEGGSLAAPASLPSEPHDHVKGTVQLASGSWLCVFENPDGTVCGAKFKPKPTVLTAPIEDEELRKDTA